MFYIKNSWSSAGFVAYHFTSYGVISGHTHLLIYRPQIDILVASFETFHVININFVILWFQMTNISDWTIFFGCYDLHSKTFKGHALPWRLRNVKTNWTVALRIRCSVNVQPFTGPGPTKPWDPLQEGQNMTELGYPWVSAVQLLFWKRRHRNWLEGC